MTEPEAPQRIAVIWSPEGRADLRAIDRETAMQILHCVDRYLANRTGDVKKLKPPFTGFRLRCGDYRVFFDQRNETTIEIVSAVIGARLIVEPSRRSTRLGLNVARNRGSVPLASTGVRVASWLNLLLCAKQSASD